MRVKQKQFKASFYRSVYRFYRLLRIQFFYIFRNCGLLWIAAQSMIVTRLRVKMTLLAFVSKQSFVNSVHLSLSEALEIQSIYL